MLNEKEERTMNNLYFNLKVEVDSWNDMEIGPYD